MRRHTELILSRADWRNVSLRGKLAVRRTLWKNRARLRLSDLSPHGQAYLIDRRYMVVEQASYPEREWFPVEDRYTKLMLIAELRMQEKAKHAAMTWDIPYDA